MDLSRRDRHDEIMDQPGLPAQSHFAALRGLERVNWISASASILWPPIRKLAKAIDRPIRILDLATGAGDVPRRLRLKAKKTGIALEVHGCDRSDHALSYARKKNDDDEAIHFFRLDVLNDPIPAGYDVICSSLFLHHLEEPEAVRLLRSMAEATNRLVLINDLRRTRLGYFLAYLGTRVLTRSTVVHVDGPLSVRAAFEIDEVRRLSALAGLNAIQIGKFWPMRFLLSWDKAGDDEFVFG